MEQNEGLHPSHFLRTLLRLNLDYRKFNGMGQNIQPFFWAILQLCQRKKHADNKSCLLVKLIVPPIGHAPVRVVSWRGLLFSLLPCCFF